MNDDGQSAQEASLQGITLWHILTAGALQLIVIPLLLVPYGRHMEMSSYSEQCAVIHFGILLIIFFMRFWARVRSSIWDVVYVYVGPMVPAIAGIVAAIIRDAG